MGITQGPVTKARCHVHSHRQRDIRANVRELFPYLISPRVCCLDLNHDINLKFRGLRHESFARSGQIDSLRLGLQQYRACNGSHVLTRMAYLLVQILHEIIFAFTQNGRRHAFSFTQQTQST